MNKNQEEAIYTRLQDAKSLLRRALIEIRDCEKQLVGERYSDMESFNSEVAPEIEEVFIEMTFREKIAEYIEKISENG